MSGLVRFGVSIEKELLWKFDKYIGEKSYPNRSEAFRDLIRESLVKREWLKGDVVAGAITIVYNHHHRELVNKLIDIQHDSHNLIISNQHIHLDHNNCLEVIIVKGSPKKIEELAYKLKATRGVKHGDFTMATTGRNIV